MMALLADAVVLATVARARLPRDHQPAVATGDGRGSRLAAGAEIATWSSCSSIPPLWKRRHAQFLITEALRGEGAYF